MREQRPVFGEDAELYDQARPSYPAALIDDVVAMVVRRVGRAKWAAGPEERPAYWPPVASPAWRSKPTRQMAAVARRNLAPYPPIGGSISATSKPSLGTGGGFCAVRPGVLGSGVALAYRPESPSPQGPRAAAPGRLAAPVVEPARRRRLADPAAPGQDLRDPRPPATYRWDWLEGRSGNRLDTSRPGFWPAPPAQLPVDTGLPRRGMGGTPADPIRPSPAATRTARERNRGGAAG